MKKRLLWVIPAILLTFSFPGAFLLEAAAQVRRPARTISPAASPTPPLSEPLIVSRAEDFADDESTNNAKETISREKTSTAESNNRIIKELQTRIKQLEKARQNDPDEKQRRLLLNLDILTKAEQRAESLRKQLFEMIEKENSLQSRLDVIANDIRPEMIERAVAGIGSFRPEELREARRRNLESERNNTQNLLTEIHRHRGSLDLNIQRADALVERLRQRMEREIDDALGDEIDQQP